MKPVEIVERYYGALMKGDLDAAAKCLHADVKFCGPMRKFDRAADLIAELRQFMPMVKSVTPLKQFVDGDDVCVWLDFETAIARGPVAEWLHVRDGKIDTLRIIYDALPYAAAIGRSLHPCRVATAVGVKTPFQTVRADFPHTAYRWSLAARHYAASFCQKDCSG